MKINFLIALLLIAWAQTGVSAQNANVTLSGQYSPSIQLSAGAPSASGGRTASVTSTGTGANAVAPPLDAANFAAVIDFGDVSRGDGTPVVASVGLRIRSNTSYRLAAAVTNFQAQSLRYLGRDVGSDDGGSFIRVWAGAPSASGSGAAATSRMTVNPALTSGTTLSALPRGSATTSSTTIVSGPAASIEGSLQSATNAVDIPLFMSVPSGYDLGPSPDGSQGTFSFSVQFAAFPGP